MAKKSAGGGLMSVINGNGNGLKPIVYDDSDHNLISIRKDTSTNASRNFISMMNLQG